MMSQIVDLLAKIPLFERFSPETLADLAQYVKLERVAPGNLLVEIGATAGRLIVILRGRVGINCQTPHGPAHETGGPGTITGILDILGNNPASTTVRAEEETAALTITRQDFESFLKAHPEEAVALLHFLARNLLERGLTLNLVVPPAAEPSQPAPETGKAAPAKKREPAAEEQVGYFYAKSHTCAFCGTRFSSPAVKSKEIRLVRTDSDFCPYYETVNPLFYEVLVCPKCGYAFTEDMPAKLNERARAGLAALLPQLRSPQRFDGIRNLPQALEAFRLAAACAETAGLKKAFIGKLYMKIAWLHRIAGNEKEEQVYTEKTLACLEESYRTEGSTDPTSELNLLYLLGDLNLRLGRENAAARWFSLILNHPQRSANPAILNRTRDRWYDARHKQRKNTDSGGEDVRDG